MLATSNNLLDKLISIRTKYRKTGLARVAMRDFHSLGYDITVSRTGSLQLRRASLGMTGGVDGASGRAIRQALVEVVFVGERPPGDGARLGQRPLDEPVSGDAADIQVGGVVEPRERVCDLGQTGAQTLVRAGPRGMHLQHGGRSGFGPYYLRGRRSGSEFPVFGERSQLAMQTRVATDNDPATLGLVTTVDAGQ